MDDFEKCVEGQWSNDQWKLDFFKKEEYIGISGKSLEVEF